MEQVFDPNKINFDLEMNELILRLTQIKRAMKDITEGDYISGGKRLDVLASLQAEATHIDKILNMVDFNKAN